MIPESRVDSNPSGRGLHPNIAEYGKVLALQGDHESALMHYREAMRLAVDEAAPEAFFRHYLECSMESIEMLGAYEDVIEYCERVDQHYDQVTPTDELQTRFISLDRATNFQRMGSNLLKLGRSEEALSALGQANQLALENGTNLPLASALIGWLQRRLTVDTNRIQAEQRRLGYFAVTHETVDPKKAVPLPDTLTKLRR
ncbi:peptidylprolyl isomerase [Granulosicoccus antarcticus]|uniref:Tetratricopeptide repeat protein n=1 Tax=Granulosicoccus antarcticus IMCC3135 TaxID=1192854 RepID=A0A2Z2NN83_9GAMM|nr:peptidylprolyl isomerase [Granulosicoccus antarcticus]ASJ71975.1 hypothetical protein IMCC3135_09390 [Granulosicoccus antarcticus IMCC3135]